PISEQSSGKEGASLWLRPASTSTGSRLRGGERHSPPRRPARPGAAAGGPPRRAPRPPRPLTTDRSRARGRPPGCPRRWPPPHAGVPPDRAPSVDAGGGDVRGGALLGDRVTAGAAPRDARGPRPPADLLRRRVGSGRAGRSDRGRRAALLGRAARRDRGAHRP